MNARLASMLAAAHAPRWRRRYGAEFQALLEELPATPAIVASATTSAFASHAPAFVAVSAVALAAAVLALGPAASDRRTVIAQKHWTAPVACGNDVAHAAPDGWGQC